MCYRCAYIYILTYASVSIHNVIYRFNINSRKLDGQYRSWIEYFNERYYVCILDRSIKLDTSIMTVSTGVVTIVLPYII